MADDKKISELDPLPSSLATGDLFEVVRSGVNYKGTKSDLPFDPAGTAATAAAAVDADLDAHTARTDNPHAVTKAQVGLGNVTDDAQTKAAIVPNTAPSAGQILVGNAGGTAYAPVSASGDIALASSGAATIADGAVTLAKMANLAQDQFIGRTTASPGVPETTTITAAARSVLDDATVSAMVDTLGGAAATGSGGLVRATSPTLVTPALGTPASGTLTNCNGLPTSGLVDGAVTYAKMQDVSATSRVIGRKTTGAGDPEELTVSEVLDFIGSAAQGDILYRGAAGWARLGAGTSGHYLQTQGAGANPQWAAGGSSGGYAPVIVRLTADAFNWADGATYYLNVRNSTTFSEVWPFRVPVSGTIKRTWVQFDGTAGSNEALTVTLRKNGSDTAISITASLDATPTGNHSTTEVIVTAGDTITAKVVTPTWATNPTGIRSELWAIIQP